MKYILKYLYLLTLFVSFVYKWGISKVMNYLYVVKLSNKTNLISYYYRGNKYYFPIILTLKSSPKIISINTIIPEKINVYNRIKPIMGPYLDFYGMKITPKMLGYTNLLFELDDGKKYTFESNDKIELI